ncbi:MAG: oligosaccharide flippase family protein [Acidobacteriia bacterium]|nr:oligosaccharide flippase family protein [Terriglobia bacterium]
MKTIDDEKQNAGAQAPKPSRTSRFLHGVWLGYANQALMLLGGLWLTPFLLHRIGQHDYGLWLVGTQVLMYLGLLDIGVVGLVPREIAYATGRSGGVESATDLPLMLGQAARVVLYQTPVVILAVSVAWFLLPASWQGFRGAIGLTMAAFVVTFPLRIFHAILQGLQDFRFVGQAQILIWIVSTTSIVILVLKGFGFYALAIGWVVTELLSAASAIYRVRSRFPTVWPHRLPPLPLSGLFRYLGRGFWISLSQIAAPLMGGTDLLIIGRLYGPSAVVPYSCTRKLIQVLQNQPNLVMQVASPGLSELKTGAPRERISGAITALTQAMLMFSGLVACVALAVNRSFVTWWVGPSLYGGATLTVLIVIEMLVRHWRTTVVYSAFCFGYERRISISSLLDGVVTVSSALLFVWWWGPVGAPLGSILGACATTLPANLYALKREIGASLATLIKPLWPWFWRLSIVLTGALAVNLRLRWPNFLGVAILASAAGLVYVAVMFQTGRDSALGTYLRPRLMAIWKRFFVSAPLLDDVQ